MKVNWRSFWSQFDSWAKKHEDLTGRVIDWDRQQRKILTMLKSRGIRVKAALLWKEFDKWERHATMALRSFPEWSHQKRAIGRLVIKQLKEQACPRTTRSR